MIQFPHAKINLGLSVVSRRTDGFHHLETVFYPVPLYDAIEILPAAETTLTITGLPVPGKTEDNLLFRAWQLLKKDHPALPALHIGLHKAIPMGAGLGGGSSDAARLLLMMNAYFDLGISDSGLGTLAAQLGSDCAFFLQAGPCIGTGRGEILEPVDLDLSGYGILLVHPEIAVSTAWAYSLIHPAPPPLKLKELMKKPVTAWKDSLINDFEAPVFDAHPQLADIKTGLYAAGAAYASMSGSGSTLFGIFEPERYPVNGLPGKLKQTLLPPGHPIW